jgi:hypothetical protein
MTRSPLVPCPGCARHVRASEAQCPFCRGDLGANGATASSGAPAARRLTRAAMFVFGATLSVAACGPKVDGGPEDSQASDAQPDTAPEDPGSPQARYGAPPPPTDAAPDPTDAGPEDTGSPMARYGAPPPSDSGPEDTGSPMARYGAPPPSDAG